MERVYNLFYCVSYFLFNDFHCCSNLELEKRIDRSAAIGAVQTVLKWMEDKGWVTSEFGEVTKERGGKRKRYYTITAKGEKIMSENREKRNNLWEAIPKLGLNYGSVGRTTAKLGEDIVAHHCSPRVSRRN